MARRSKRDQEQVVEMFIGIDRDFKVKTVYLTRGGTLVMYTHDMVPHRQPLFGGRDPKTEIIIVYGLTEISRVRPGDNEYEERVRQELQAKADAMKAEKAGKS